MKPDKHPFDIHLRFRRTVRIRPGETVTLGRAAQFITEPELERELNGLVLCRPDKRDGSIILIDLLLVIRKVKEKFPEARFGHIGEPHVLVEVAMLEKAPNWLLVALVWLLLFIGSGLAIMNFHADVSMVAVHRRIYELLTGEQIERPFLLQIPYSLGIGIGMVLFFNHLFRKKFNEEPSPLEVEMYLYQDNMNRFMVSEEYAKLEGAETEDSILTGERKKSPEDGA